MASRRARSFTLRQEAATGSAGRGRETDCRGGRKAVADLALQLNPRRPTPQRPQSRFLRTDRRAVHSAAAGERRSGGSPEAGRPSWGLARSGLRVPDNSGARRRERASDERRAGRCRRNRRFRNCRRGYRTALRDREGDEAPGRKRQPAKGLLHTEREYYFLVPATLQAGKHRSKVRLTVRTGAAPGRSPAAKQKL